MARRVDKRVLDAGVVADAAVPRKPAPRVVQLSMGNRHVCALSDAGTVRCWGTGPDGQLGYGNTETIGDDEPAGAAGDVDLGGPAVQIAAGSRHTCALMQSGAVRCWGLNRDGCLGYGHNNNIGDDETPASAGDVRLGGRAVQVDAGSDMTCALLDDGTVRCWGNGSEHRLGRGFSTSNIGDDESPAEVPVMDIGAKVTQIALETGSGCALLESRDVRCWGHQWGREDVWDKKPSQVANVRVGGPVKRLIAGGQHTCALLERGGLRCWGGFSEADLGYAGLRFVSVDEDFDKLGDVQVGGEIIDGSADSSHTCVVLAGGAVRCWGENHIGQLGRGDKVVIGDDETPASAPPVDIGGPVRHIAVGGFAACALLESGAVRCWGSGKYGRLGYGNTETIGDDETPASAGDVAIF